MWGCNQVKKMPKMHMMAALGFASLALSACGQAARIDQTDPEVTQGIADVRSGKHGKDAQDLARQMDSLHAMSPSDRADYLSKMNAANQGK